MQQTFLCFEYENNFLYDASTPNTKTQPNKDDKSKSYSLAYFEYASTSVLLGEATGEHNSASGSITDQSEIFGHIHTLAENYDNWRSQVRCMHYRQRGHHFVQAEGGRGMRQGHRECLGARFGEGFFLL